MPKISTRVVCVNGKQSCTISLDRSAEKLDSIFTQHYIEMMVSKGLAAPHLFKALIGFWTLKEMILSLLFDTCILYQKISVKFSQKQQKSGFLTCTFRFWGSIKLLRYLIA